MLYSILVGLIKKRKEGNYWDYKECWHSSREKLIHDILCFANTLHDRDCYLIIGVSDDFEIMGVDKSDPYKMKQNDLLDLVHNLSFSGGSIPQLSLDSIELEGKLIDVITIYNSDDTPYFLSKTNSNYKKLKAGVVYSRIEDRNTPISVGADFDTVEKLWKKRFGLLTPRIDMFFKHLKNKYEWNRYGGSHYNIYNPNMRMDELEAERDCDNPRFYVFTQRNSRFKYKALNIMYNTTILMHYDLVALDSCRYVTPTPEVGSIMDDNYNTTYYRYFLKDSFTHELQKYLFDENNDEERSAKRRFDEVVLYFDNSDEKDMFENYFLDNETKYNNYLNDFSEAYFDIDSGNERMKKSYREELLSALAFKKLLDDFRSIRQITPCSS